MGSIRMVGMGLGVALALANPAFCQDRGREPKATGTAPTGSRGDPDMFFKGLSKGKDVLIRSQMDPNLQHLYDMLAKKAGATDGKITIDQFRRVYAEGKNEGAGMRKSAPKTEATDVATPPSGIRMDRRGNGNGNGRTAMSADNFASWADNAFRLVDHNRDGVLEFEEMPEDLQVTLDTWDDNENGIIDLEEYRRYYVARVQQRVAEREENGIATPWSNTERDEMPSSMPGRDNQRKPLVYNSKNLPQNIPSWFRELDQNNDAQVSLFEWRQGKDKSLNDFARYDRNNDGFITVEDILRSNGGSSNGGSDTRSARGDAPPRGSFMPNGNGNGNGNGWDRRMVGRPSGDNSGERPRFNRPGGDARGMRRGGGDNNGERPRFNRPGGEGGERSNFPRPGGNRERRGNSDSRPGEKDQ